MRSLFLKIFLWFWVTAIATGVVLALMWMVVAGSRHHAGASATPVNFALRWIVALLVSGFICYLLTRYLTAPIMRLRQASRQIASGDLTARAESGMEGRHDEVGALVRDFNAMGSRIEELVSRQRQLIYDISHELRSPLARLNVALDLSRQRKGDDPAFDQMERDLERLNDMIGRLLSLARLDRAVAPVSMARIDLAEIVSRIVDGAAFELGECDRAIQFSCDGQFMVQGNAELLYSALENIVRNAIRYTLPGTTVEVQIESDGTPSMIRIRVLDHGPGVPESDLGKIFLPFYRVDDDRNSGSGGTGLGLAVAAGVLHIHNGSIQARNRATGGLEVEICLPLEDLRA